MKHSDRVQWKEGNYHQHTCTGSIICNTTNFKGESTDYWEISVDDSCYHRACYTASEMSSHTVCRSKSINSIEKLVD